MAESNATERLETCIRHHSRTCTCGITEPQCMAYAAAEAADGDPDCTTGPFKAEDIEAKHEALRADVMTAVSDPHLTWEQARQALRAALSQ